MGKREKKMFCVSYFICSHGCTRRNLCFTLKIVSTLIKTAHVKIDRRSRHTINLRPTRFVSGKANECRRRPRRYQVDPWSRGREVAHGVLRSSLKPEKNYILPSERDRDFCRLFSTHQRPNVVVSDAWSAPATQHQPSCEHCDQRVGRSP